MLICKLFIISGHEAYVHHMVLYECHVKDSSVWFDHHAGATGEACYSPNMPPEWTFCLATNAWAWVSTIKFITPDLSTLNSLNVQNILQNAKNI